jgi:hypothetical protein
VLTNNGLCPKIRYGNRAAIVFIDLARPVAVHHLRSHGLAQAGRRAHSVDPNFSFMLH